MPKQVQRRRGTSTAHSTFTGALGEITVDTTNNALRLHDGSTAGGFPIHKFASTVTTLTANRLIRASSTTELNTSIIRDDGTNVGINATSTGATLHVESASGVSEIGIIRTTNTGTQLRFKNSIQEWLIGNSVAVNNEFTIRDVTDSRNVFHIDTSSNIGFNTTSFGTSAAKVLAIGAGTAPTTSPADAVQMWVADRNGSAGNAILHIREETGDVIVLGRNIGPNTSSTADNSSLRLCGSNSFDSSRGGAIEIVGVNASSNAGDIRIFTGNASGDVDITTGGALRWSFLSSGQIQSNGSQTIQTSTGNLTLATAAGNGDVLISPHGTGNLRFGTHSTIGALTVTGYIPIKDAAGTTRNLAVVS